MAYGVKYSLTYKNPNKVEFRLDIEVDGYVGDIFQISTTSEPFVKKQNNSGQFPKLESMRATFADINVYEDENFNLNNLLTSSETHIRVRHYKNNLIDWTGFVMPDFYSESISEPRIIRLTATDRLGVLKNEPVSVNYLYTTFLDLIRECLTRTGIILPIKTVVGFKESSSLNFNRPLINSVQGERLFNQNKSVLNCYDVLKSILTLFNAYVIQQDGYWLIINREQAEIGGGMMTEYNITTGQIEVVSEVPFVRPVIDIDYVYTQGERTIQPVLSTVSILGEHGGSKIYPDNNNFRIWNGSSFESWVPKKSYSLGNYVNEPTKYLPTGKIDVAYSIPGTVNKLLNKNQLPFIHGLSMVTGINRMPYLESAPFNILSYFKGDNDVVVKYKFNVTGKSGFMPLFSIVLETSNTSNIYYTFNAVSNVLLKAGSDKNNLYGSSNAGNQPVESIIKGKYGVLFGSIDNPRSPVAATTTDISGELTIPKSLLLGLEYCRVIVRSLPTLFNTLSPDTASVELLLNKVNLTVDDNVEKPKGDLYRIDQVGNFTAKTSTPVSVFSDYLFTGLNGYFYNYPIDDTSSIIPIGSTSWQTVGDSQEAPILLHSVRQMSKLYSEAHNQLNITVDLDDIDVLSVFNILCKNEKYNVTSFSINYHKGTVNVVLSEIKRGTKKGVEYIYSYYGDEAGTNVSSLGNVGGTSGGGGGGAQQGLASVASIGHETPLVLELGGSENSRVLGAPSAPPPIEDMKPGIPYIYVNHNAPPGEDPGPGTDGYLRDLLDVDVAGVVNGQALTYDAAKNKWVPATPLDLTGYARESWVLAQDYAPKSWVAGQGFLTTVLGDNRYKPLSYVPSWGEITGKPLINVQPLSDSLVQRNDSGHIYANYFNTMAGIDDFGDAFDSVAVISSQGFIARSSKGLFNKFLGMPSNGDTLQSVMDRDSYTSSFMKIAGVDNVSNGDGLELFFTESKGYINSYGRGTSNSYLPLTIASSDLTVNSTLSNFNGKLRANVMQPDVFICPSDNPSQEYTLKILT